MWRIYYGNGKTSDEQQSADDVQIIVGYRKNGERYLLHRWDWYYLRNDEWNGADIHGLLDQLKHVPGITQVKQGRTIDTEVYEGLLKQAINDPDFPKTGTNRESKSGQVYGDGK